MGASGSGIEGKARPLCLSSAKVERRILAIFGDTEGSTTQEFPLALTALHSDLTNAPRVHVCSLSFQRIVIPLLSDCLNWGSHEQMTGKDGFLLSLEL